MSTSQLTPVITAITKYIPSKQTLRTPAQKLLTDSYFDLILAGRPMSDDQVTVLSLMAKLPTEEVGTEMVQFFKKIKALPEDGFANQLDRMLLEKGKQIVEAKAAAAARGRAALRRGVKRIVRAFPIGPDGAFNPDCVGVRVWSNEESYAKEVATGELIGRSGVLHPAPPLTKKQLQEQLGTYDKDQQRLLDASRKPLNTRSHSAKGQEGKAGFVMGKKPGEFYVFKHGKQPAGEQVGNFVSHGAVLNERPVEMAGLIEIEAGRITHISDDSGHYAPEKLDMYRFIQRLKQEMPGVITKDCEIKIGKTIVFLSTFIHEMETPESNGKPKHQNLKEERVQRWEEYQQFLDSKVSSQQCLQQAAEAGQGIGAHIIKNPYAQAQVMSPPPLVVAAPKVVQPVVNGMTS